MKNILVKFTIIGAACSLSLAALAQGNMGSDSDSSKESTGSKISNWEKEHLGATGRSQQAVRGSKLMQAEVQDSSGQKVGRIEDVIINPTSGKIDFAVISRSNMGGASSPSRSSSGAYGSTGESQSQSSESGATSPESSATSKNTGKLIPVPWAMLQPSSSSGSTAGSALYGQQSFTLNIDQSKLDQAPSISRGNWSEITQPNWRERINSYFGQSTGGAESPSGTEQGTGSGR
jgi:sporulation protein YlmC with PRC-barrel domain